ADDDGDGIMEEWTSDNRATIDGWQCRLADAIKGRADGRGAVIEAFEAGALAVHREWLAAHDRCEGPPRGDPDFGEAARDYALSQAPATDGAKLPPDWKQDQAETSRLAPSHTRPDRQAPTDSKPQKVCLYTDGCP